MATENNGLLSMDPNNYEYSFDNTINIREIYYKIVDSEPNNQHLYEEISKNYVTIGEQILKSISKRAGIKVGKNDEFGFGYSRYKCFRKMARNNGFASSKKCKKTIRTRWY